MMQINKITLLTMALDSHCLREVTLNFSEMPKHEKRLFIVILKIIYAHTSHYNI